MTRKQETLASAYYFKGVAEKAGVKYIEIEGDKGVKEVSEVLLAQLS